MKPFAILSLLLSLAAFADTDSSYQKGTLTKQAGQVPLYELAGANTTVWVKPCGQFTVGQTIEFRIAGNNVYIQRDNGGEYKCSIAMRTVPSNQIDAPLPNTIPPGGTYQKGTILGYTTRRDVNGSGRDAWTRYAKVYELRGSDLVYQVDYCGAFQAGQFSPGQVVQFRVDQQERRLYILHDVKKEYSCQLEGTRLPKAQAPPASNASQASPGMSENASK